MYNNKSYILAVEYISILVIKKIILYYITSFRQRAPVKLTIKFTF